MISDSQVKTLRVYAFQMAARWGIIMAGRMRRLILLNGSCRREKSGFYAVANEQEAGSLLCENKGDIFCAAR